MKNKQKIGGFTLIELLVVIVIIVTLATISVATFSSYQKKSRDAKREIELSQMAKAVEIDYTINERVCGLGPYSTKNCIIDILKKNGLTLPPANKDCYVLGVDMSNPTDFFIISTEQYLDKVLVFHGTSPVKNLFDPEGGTNDKFKGTNNYRMSAYIRNYKNLGCTKGGVGGNAAAFNREVNGYPGGSYYYYFLAPLDPALQ